MKQLLLVITILLLSQPIAIAQNAPESYGFNSSKLIDLVEFISTQEIAVHSMHVSRFDSIFFELYAAPFNDEMLHDVASVTKSIISILTWIALADGIISDLNKPATELLPDKYLQDISARLKQVTVRNLLDMRSGWDCGLSGGEAELTAMRNSEEWIQEVLSMSFRSEPGTDFSYCSPNYHLLAAIIHYQTGDLLQFASRRLFEPLGIENFDWPRDPQGIPHGWGDLALKPSDMLKIGHLLKNEGIWNQKRILPGRLFTEIHRNMVTNDYRIGFWFSESEYEANGRGGQRITIIPALDIVIVMTGGGFEPALLGSRLGDAYSGQDQITPDSTGYLELLKRLDKLNEIPSEKASLDSFVLFDGKKYLFNENELGFNALKLTENESGLSLQFWLADGITIVHPLRKDGILTVRTDNQMGQAGRVVASTYDTVIIEFDTLSRINRYMLSLNLSDTRAVLEVSDLTNQTVYRLTEK